ncbi:MAG: hypothetical protein J2O46_00630 [Nocardioides sp.]|nr:hypothetical protein [Nocardioides sp.]
MASTMDPLASERYTVVLEAEKLTRLQRAFRLAVWMVFESPASADVYGDATLRGPREKVVVRVLDRWTDSVATEYDFEEMVAATKHAAHLRAELEKFTASEFTARLNLQQPQAW